MVSREREEVLNEGRELEREREEGGRDFEQEEDRWAALIDTKHNRGKCCRTLFRLITVGSPLPASGSEGEMSGRRERDGVIHDGGGFLIESALIGYISYLVPAQGKTLD